MWNRRSFLAVVVLSALAGCSSKFRRYNGPQVTRILVFKSKRKMYLMHGDEAIRVYDIALGGNPVGDKEFEGDNKTPEGAYFIDRRNPNSAYHLSLGISYPNLQDVANAEAMGKSPGGDIFIHGRAEQKGKRNGDWTAGCISITDREIEEVYSMIRTGTPILIQQ
jgi:murein L,D-transpeptidase YafK